MLEQVKTALGVTGSYQNDTIQSYIDDIIAFLKEAGISENTINDNVPLVARGVADIWNYGSGKAELSVYFIQRAIQLAIKDSKVK